MSTNEDAATGNSDFIGHGDAASKYLLLKVPSYSEDSGTRLYQAAKDTYLNLGRGMGHGSSSAPGWAANKWSATGLADDAVTTPNVSGEDLLASFGGFIDDTRKRDTGGTFDAAGTPPNETAARASAAYSAPGATASTTGTGRNLKVTQLIPDYVGWRDHTDGHRITTTRGDKIEIIGGNYKLVSLGRGTGVASLEMSGGLTIAADEAPGNTTSVTWRPVPTGSSGESGWKVVEQVVKGNAVERFHGTKREEFYGDKIISVIGSPDEASSGLKVGANQNGDPETYVGGGAATSTKNVASDGTLDTYAYPTKWDLEDDTPPKLQRPAIYESTWASSISEYTQSEGTWTTYNRYKGEHKESNVFDKGHINEITLKEVGSYYQEVWYLMGSGGFMERFHGSFLQFFLGSSTTMGLANRFELYVSTEEQVNLGLLLGLSLGAHFEVNIAYSKGFDLFEDKFQIGTQKIRMSEANTYLTKTIAQLNETIAAVNKDCASVSNKQVSVITKI